MDVITLEVKPRKAGTRAARAIRREGNVPCVLYGSHVEPVIFEVPALSLNPLIYTTEKRRVEIKMDGDTWECILKDIDFHPVTDQPIHVDFQVLQQGEKITFTVPLRFHGTPVGQVDEGGDTQYNTHELEITCLPEHIPSHIDVDISGLHIGDTVHIRDLDVPNVEFSGAPERSLVTVVPPRVEEPEPEEVEAALAAEGEDLEGQPEDAEEEAGAKEEEAEE